VTEVAHTGIPGGISTRLARPHVSEKELADFTIAIGLMNIGFRVTPKAVTGSVVSASAG
jgi:hypothetical protein